MDALLYGWSCTVARNLSSRMAWTRGTKVARNLSLRMAWTHGTKAGVVRLLGIYHQEWHGRVEPRLLEIYH